MKALFASSPITNLFGTRGATFEVLSSDTLSNGNVVSAMRWTTETGAQRSFNGFVITNGDGEIVQGPVTVDSGGRPLGSGTFIEHRVSGATVTALDGGGFVLNWQKRTNDDFGVAPERKVQIFSNTGQSQGQPFDPYDIDFQIPYVIVPLSGGGFATVTINQGSIGNPGQSDMSIQVFNKRGRPVGEAMDVDVEGTPGSFSSNDPVVRGPGGQSFVVFNTGNFTSLIRLNSDGEMLGNSVGITNSSPNFEFSFQNDALVADLGNGRIAVAYRRTGLDASDGIVVQAMNPNGASPGRERALDLGEVAPQELQLLSLKGGGALLIWVDGQSGTMYGQQIAPTGKFKGPMTEITSVDAGGLNVEAAVAGDGDVLVHSVYRFDEDSSTLTVVVTKDSGDATIGNRQDNRLNGTNDDDVISGERGDDTINLGRGNDAGHGDVGNDTINGSRGNDLLHGDAGRDLLIGGPGLDIIRGGVDADDIRGGGGADLLRGGEGNDKINGQGGADDIRGGAGNDNLIGGGGGDTLRGEDGHDRIDGGGGNDILVGLFGNDRLNGGKGNDRLLGYDGNDRLNGGGGNDEMFAERGNDTLTGGPGSDTFIIDTDCETATFTDFTLADDMLQIRLNTFGGTVPTLEEIFSDMVEVVQGDTVIDLGGGRVATLEGVRNLTQLQNVTTLTDFFGEAL